MTSLEGMEGLQARVGSKGMLVSSAYGLNGVERQYQDSGIIQCASCMPAFIHVLW